MKYLIQDLPKISMGLPHEKNILVGFFYYSNRLLSIDHGL